MAPWLVILKLINACYFQILVIGVCIEWKSYIVRHVCAQYSRRENCFFDPGPYSIELSGHRWLWDHLCCALSEQHICHMLRSSSPSFPPRLPELQFLLVKISIILLWGHPLIIIICNILVMLWLLLHACRCHITRQCFWFASQINVIMSGCSNNLFMHTRMHTHTVTHISVNFLWSFHLWGRLTVNLVSQWYPIGHTVAVSPHQEGEFSTSWLMLGCTWFLICFFFLHRNFWENFPWVSWP